MSKSSAIFLTFCQVFAFLANYGAADFRAASCNYKRNYTKGSLTEKNLQTVLGELRDSSSQPAAYKTSYAPAATARGGVGQNSSATTAIYGLLQCYAGTSSSQCNECARDAVISTPASCPNATAAMAWFDDCFLRFDNSNFTGVLDTSDVWYMWNVDKAPDDGAGFDIEANLLLNYLVSKALLQRPSAMYGFASTVLADTTIYGFVQCWRGISVKDCENCLRYAILVLQQNVKGKQGGRTVAGSCVVRYEIYPFFTPTTPSPPLPSPAPPRPLPHKTAPLPSPVLNSNDSMIIGATAGSLMVVLLLLVGGFLAYRVRRRNLETGATEDTLADEDEMTMFSMKTLKRATNNFDENLKIGEGGFGVVYKATLRNGKVVAAKRLLVPSTRGKQEFVNETNLLAKIQHRNLINLLGCCTEGSDRILVYEFLPNGSLDKILFDRQKAKFLNWEKRYNIILETAKVLRYLHEESKIRIIHRDIKSSNILLDEKFHAKLADFGLARLFQEDQSHIQTGFAGTHGYIAPEYAIQGQLSSKSDVYSFGVLIVEIVTGKTNSEFRTNMTASSLLGWAWSLYQEGNISMMVDEVVKATDSIEEVIRCIHVAFLCTQIDPSWRPPMSTVLLMLSSAIVTLPIPTKPAFFVFNHNVERTQKSIQNNLTLIDPSPSSQHFTNATVSISDIDPR